MPECVLYTDEASKLAHKIPIMERFNEDSGKGIPIISPFLDKPTSITDESFLLRNLTSPISLKRIYVDRKHATEAKCIVKQYLAEEDNDEE